MNLFISLSFCFSLVMAVWWHGWRGKQEDSDKWSIEHSGSFVQVYYLQGMVPQGELETLLARTYKHLKIYVDRGFSSRPFPGPTADIPLCGANWKCAQTKTWS